MAHFEHPSWTRFDDLVASASSSLLLCAPYVTRPGLDRVERFLRNGVEVSVITRISVDDWVQGVCDPVALLGFVSRIGAHGIQVSNRLHAKAIVADWERGLVGSANLTRRAYTHNLEIQGALEPIEAGQVLDLVASWQDSLRVLAVVELGTWVDRHRDAVFAERRRIDDEAPSEDDGLGDAQRELDEMAGGRLVENRPYRSVDERLLEDFIEWLVDHPNLAGADEIVARHDNRYGVNLTGHVKQCFFATYLFFQFDPDWIGPATALLDALAPNDIAPLDGELLGAWVEHVESNAGLQSAVYSFPVLRGYLPPRLGGTRLGGGGGSSTLKRVLPLVAHWFEDF